MHSMRRRSLLLIAAISVVTLGLVAVAAQSESDAARVVAAPPVAPEPEPALPPVVRSTDGRTASAEKLAEGRTRLTVADASKQERTYDFERNLEPEAFGIGTPFLFVVDHRPASNPTYYRVAAVNLDDGSFLELAGPDKKPLEDMTSTARHQVASHTGDQLYTLYVQHKHTAAHEGVDPAALPVAAFIHVLDLRGTWAACVDLPGFGHGPVAASSIELSADGDTVVVTDTFAGKRARVQTVDLTTDAMRTRMPPVEIESISGSPRQD